MSQARKTEKKTKIQLIILRNIYVLSSTITFFRSVTRARIYLTNNITLALRLAFSALKNIPRSPSADIIAPVFPEARWCDPKRHGSDVLRSRADTLYTGLIPGDIYARRYTPPCRHASRTFCPRGIPYHFQLGRFVTSDLNLTTAPHSTPITQSNN
jgi:hypothetical protein